MRNYGWKPDIPDMRDHLFAPTYHNTDLPESVDLRALCSPVEDQGALGSCTGNAIAGALEYLFKEEGTPIDVSRLYIYYQERKIEGTIKQDAGAMIRDGIKACASMGVPLESVWPYNVAKFAAKPPKSVDTDAAKRKIASYRRVMCLDDLLHCLANGNPVVFGFSVYESFESDAVAKTGIVPMPHAKERMIGGHAVLAVGYHQTEEFLIVRNSWGNSWGNGGYFTLPFGYIRNKNLSDDFWIITK